MNKVEEVKLDITSRAATAIKRDGYYTIHTCSAPNWSVETHIAMKQFQQRAPEHMKVDVEILHGVCDWTITEDPDNPFPKEV